jgi:hypothetical protein
MHLPWYESEFCKAARLPTSRLVVLTYSFKMIMLLVTLCAQLGLLLTTGGISSGGTFTTIIIMNLGFSLVVFVIKGVEMWMKYAVLRGSQKNEDSDAARRMHNRRSIITVAKENKKSKTESDAEEGGGDTLDMGDLYHDPCAGGGNGDHILTDNPMHATRATTLDPIGIEAPPGDDDDDEGDYGESIPLTHSHARQLEIFKRELRDEMMQKLEEQAEEMKRQIAVIATRPAAGGPTPPPVPRPLSLKNSL